MPFDPPNGQCCTNCRCHARAHGLDFCALFPPGWQNCPMPVMWCGHWRPARDLRCGECRHIHTWVCPRSLSDTTVTHPRRPAMVPSGGALACTDWEAKE